MSQLIIARETDPARAIVAAQAPCHEAGLSRVECTQVQTAASELSRNILKYVGRGSLHIQVVELSGRLGVRLVAQDGGSGIADIEAALRDHHSTGGTLGLGLPGVRRMMDEFEIVSGSAGTKITCTKWGRREC